MHKMCVCVCVLREKVMHIQNSHLQNNQKNSSIYKHVFYPKVQYIAKQLFQTSK